MSLGAIPFSEILCYWRDYIRLSGEELGEAIYLCQFLDGLYLEARAKEN